VRSGSPASSQGRGLWREESPLCLSVTQRSFLSLITVYIHQREETRKRDMKGAVDTNDDVPKLLKQNIKKRILCHQRNKKKNRIQISIIL